MQLPNAARVSILVLTLFATVAARADDNGKRAKQAFQEGRSYFQLAQFDRAIEAWQRAYQLKPDPSLLYNIAQAHRLAGHLEQALLTYESYLNHAPNSKNRAEVELNIRDLKREIAEQHQQPVETAPVVPSVRPSPPTDGEGARPGPVQPQPTGTQTTPPPPPPPPAVEPEERNFDIGLAIGGNFWVAGVPSGGDPSVAFALLGGYTLRPLSTSQIETRIVARFAVAFLSDGADTDTMLSIVAGPALRFWLSERFYAAVEVAAGIMILQGVTQSSILFAMPIQTVTGALSAFELRPGVALGFALSPAFSLELQPVLSYSPSPSSSFKESSLVRFSVSVGAMLRF